MFMRICSKNVFFATHSDDVSVSVAMTYRHTKVGAGGTAALTYSAPENA